MKGWVPWVAAGLAGAATWWFFEGRRGENPVTSKAGEAIPVVSNPSDETRWSEDRTSHPGVSQSDAELATAGNREAMRRLGDVYRTGHGEKQDDETAAKWYRKAAEKGDAEAQWRLGECYRDGRGVARDAAWAKIWFKAAERQGLEQARRELEALESKEHSEEIGEGEIETCRKLAEEGDSRAQCLMGEWCLSGRATGVRDEKAGAEWFRRAAEAGDAEGQRQWGHCLAEGLGVERDRDAAQRWLKEATFRGNEDALAEFEQHWKWAWRHADDEMMALHKAASEGDAGAQGRLGKQYLLGTRDGLSTWAAVENAKRSGLFHLSEKYEARQAVRWLEVAAKGGDVEAMYWLGACFAVGIGVEANEATAMRLLAAAERKGLSKAGEERARRLGQEGVLREQANQGNRAAQFELGTILAGRGEHEGIVLLQKLAEFPDGLAAALWLERHYAGVDRPMMVHWCHRAADLGNLGALHRMLGHEPQHALSWWKKIYEIGGGTEAARAIGHCYETGEGCLKNFGEAKRWYQRAGDSYGVARVEQLEKEYKLFGTQ